MFDYRGSSDLLRDCIGAYRNRLENAYRKVLGNKGIGLVERLDCPELIHTPRVESVTKTSESITSIPNNIATANMLFMNATLLALEEVMTREIDRRVLGELGYDATPWVNFGLERTDDPSSQFARNLGIKLQGFTDKEFSEFLIDYDKKIKFGSKFIGNLYLSLQQYRMQKTRTSSVDGLAEFVEAGIEGFAASGDNVCGAIFLSSKSSSTNITDRIKIDDEGYLNLKNTSRIVTAPLIIISDYGVQNVTEPDLKGTNLPPYLVALVHEFDHFVGYCLERIPSTIVLTLLNLKLKELSKI